jgi:hypothetical protein
VEKSKATTDAFVDPLKSFVGFGGREFHDVPGRRIRQFSLEDLAIEYRAEFGGDDVRVCRGLWSEKKAPQRGVVQIYIVGDLVVTLCQ